MGNRTRSPPAVAGGARNPEDSAVVIGSAIEDNARSDESSKTEDRKKLAVTGGNSNIKPSAFLSAFDQNRHYQATCPRCQSKDRCPFAPVQDALGSKTQKLSVPKHGQKLPSSQMKHALAAIETGLEAYEPIKRWQDERFEEQPWHGIARDLTPDDWTG